MSVYATLPLIFTNPLSRDVTQDTSMSYGYVNIQSDTLFTFFSSKQNIKIMQ